MIAICAPIAGLVIDWFGRKKLMLSALVLYGLSGRFVYTFGALNGIILIGMQVFMGA